MRPLIFSCFLFTFLFCAQSFASKKKAAKNQSICSFILKGYTKFDEYTFDSEGYQEGLEGQKLIGSKIFIRKDDGTEVHGTVIFDDENEGYIQYYVNGDDKYFDINLFNLQGDTVLIKKSDKEWKEVKLEEALKSDEMHLVSLFVFEGKVVHEFRDSTYENGYTGRSHFRYGRLSRVGKEPYQYLQLTSPDGTTHEFDTKYFTIDVFSSENAEGPQGLSNKKIQIIDQRLEDRNTLAQKLFQDSQPFLHQKSFYEFFSSKETQNLLKKWYGKDSEALIKEMTSKVGANYLPLLLDPGVVSHLDDFIREAQKILKTQPNISTINLRAEVSKALGTRKLYRSVAVENGSGKPSSEEQLNIVNPKILQTKEALIQTFLNLTDPHNQVSSRANSWNELIGSRTSDSIISRSGSPLNSASRYENVASSIALYPEGTWTREAKKAALVFELEIPLLDTLVFQGIFSELSPFVSSGRNSQFFSVGSEQYSFNDSGLEILINSPIRSEQIKSIRTIKSAPVWKPE